MKHQDITRKIQQIHEGNINRRKDSDKTRRYTATIRKVMLGWCKRNNKQYGHTAHLIRWNILITYVGLNVRNYAVIHTIQRIKCSVSSMKQYGTINHENIH